MGHEKIILSFAAIFFAASSANSQSGEELVATYETLEQMANVCVTNPCPVQRFEKKFMGIDFQGMRMVLPDGSNREIMQNTTASARIWICHRRNYVEPDAFSCVEL